MDDIKQAYRQLVQQIHPDKHHGDEEARQQFIRISTAYHTLLHVVQGIELGKKIGICSLCRKFEEVVEGPDGHVRCSSCALAGRRGRFLPLPVIVLVKCAGSLFLNITTIILLILAVINQSPLIALSAFLTGLASLISLAYTCLTVVYCMTRREQIRYRYRRTLKDDPP